MSLSPEDRARDVCELMEARMRTMGVITTAHYDAGLPLIAEAIHRAVAAERRACARAAAEAIQDAVEAIRSRGGPAA